MRDHKYCIQLKRIKSIHRKGDCVCVCVMKAQLHESQLEIRSSLTSCVFGVSPHLPVGRHHTDEPTDMIWKNECTKTVRIQWKYTAGHTVLVGASSPFFPESNLGSSLPIFPSCFWIGIFAGTEWGDYSFVRCDILCHVKGRKIRLSGFRIRQDDNLFSFFCSLLLACWHHEFRYDWTWPTPEAETGYTTFLVILDTNIRHAGNIVYRFGNGCSHKKIFWIYVHDYSYFDSFKASFWHFVFLFLLWCLFLTIAGVAYF